MLALSLYMLRLLIPWIRKQRYKKAYHIHRDSHRSGESWRSLGHVGQLQAVPAGRRDRGAQRDDGGGREGGLRSSPRTGPGGAPSGRGAEPKASTTVAMATPAPVRRQRSA